MSNKTLQSDSVIEEVWRIKEEISAEHGNSVRSIARSSIEKQGCYSHKLVDLYKIRENKRVELISSTAHSKV